MLVVLTETYCNKVNIHITQRDDLIEIEVWFWSAEFVVGVVPSEFSWDFS